MGKYGPHHGQEMATTNFVRIWKDGDRKFVNLNGATIEVASFSFDEGIVTLQFNARVAPLRLGDDFERELAIAASQSTHSAGSRDT